MMPRFSAQYRYFLCLQLRVYSSQHFSTTLNSVYAFGLLDCASSNQCKYSSNDLKLIHGIKVYYRMFQLKMVYIRLTVHAQSCSKDYRLNFVNGRKFM